MNSPIHQMIDEACGVEESKPRYDYELSVEEKASYVAMMVMSHINEMYPAISRIMGKSAKQSIKNTIYNEIMLKFE